MSCLPRLPNELLHEVCSSPCLSQHDRSALARVSKDWHHVATPVLWRQLPGLLPLLKLIPEDAWTSELIQYDDFQWPDDPTERITITRRLGEEDWARVHRRASLVRVLEVHSSYATSFSECDSRTVRIIKACPPSRCLLPNLHSVRIAIVGGLYPGRHLDSLLRMLLSPNIIGDRVEDLSYNCSCLAHYRSGIHAAILGETAVTRWNHLKSVKLELERCNPSLLATFSQIPALQSLYLGFQDIPTSPDIIPASLTPGFPSLRSLGLHAVFCLDIAAVLRSWDFRALTRLAAEEIDCDDPDELQEFFQTVQDCVAHDALTDFTVDTGYADIGPLSFVHIKPLAVFRRLVHVRIDLLDGLYPTDSEHAQVAAWWPEVESIHLGTEACSGNWDRVNASLESLIHYARFCPRLRSLCLPLLVHSPIPKIPTDMPSQAAGHPLTRLDLGDTPLRLENVADVTRLLRDLFPHLHEVDYPISRAEWSWGDVNTRLALEKNGGRSLV